MSFVGRRLASAVLRTRTRPRAASSAFATVAEVTVNVTFIDHEGRTASVPGRVGQTVAEVAHMHDIDVGPAPVGGVMQKVHSERWTETLFGEGPMFGYDHVQIPLDWQAKGSVDPPTTQETELLERFWDKEDLRPSSRLACMIPLGKAMDGVPVFIPDGIPPPGYQ